MTPPVPAHIYAKARKMYLGTAIGPWADDSVVREWAQKRWGDLAPSDSHKLSFWVLSMAAQDSRW